MLFIALLLSAVLPASGLGDRFVWGAATSAFQVEGCATMSCGRGPSIWDEFAETSRNIADNATASVADDSYHQYFKDIDLLATGGFNSYRFSISWSRIFPNGTGFVNTEGVDYYNNLINALLDRNIEPYVTLYHWDLPLALHRKYGGWLSSDIVADFESYAGFCFSTFGDRVKHWMTLNEVILNGL